MSLARHALGLLLCGLSAVASAQSVDGSIGIATQGAVARVGTASYPAKTRLSTVALAAKIDPRAYILGAAWLRPSLRRDQLRLRAGLLYELGAIRLKGIGSHNDALAENAQQLQTWLATLPVTGRRLATVLDPYRLEVTPADNWTVADGDALYYPLRPEGIRVVGAVIQPCHLSLQPLQDARRYLKSCPASKAADRNRIFVVQPDGAVYEQNIALWNRDPPRPLAPGAWIYVPLDQHTIGGTADATFNRDLADFLATQLLSEEGWH